MTKCIHCGGDQVDCCRVGRADQYNCPACGSGWVVVAYEDYDQKAVTETITVTPALEDSEHGDSNLAG